jgi:hypothetical protein
MMLPSPKEKEMTMHANAICLVGEGELDAVALTSDDLDSVLGGTTCYDIGRSGAIAQDSGNKLLMAFWSGVFTGYGCRN